MKQKNILIISLAAILILIDQLVKWFIITHPGFLNKILFLTKNDRFVLGYGPGYDLFFWIVISSILILAIFSFEKSIKANLAFAIMISGALGNLIDRLFRGGVIDYFRITMHYDLFFNLADIYLIVGLFLYLYVIGKENEKKHSN